MWMGDEARRGEGKEFHNVQVCVLSLLHNLNVENYVCY
jgi:hypothetical protein